MRFVRLPGIVGYVSMALWFLLMVMAAPVANAQEFEQGIAPIEVVGIPVSDILPAIEAALAAKGAGIEATIELSNPTMTINVTPGVDPVFHSVSFNRSNGRFLIRAQGAPGSPAIAIAGIATTSLQIPVLSSDIAKGQLITAGDIEWIDSANPRNAFFLTDAEDIIGKAARRALRGGAPLRRYDVATPVLVKKGDLVTMTLASAGLRLSHIGVAMSSGGAGDLIEIKNIKSERIIKAIVRGKNIAEIPTRQAALETAPGNGGDDQRE